MKNKALLVRGKEGPLDNPEEFNRISQENLEIIKEVVGSQGYSSKEVPLEKITEEISRCGSLDKLFFYFTGHANQYCLGKNGIFTNEIFADMDKFDCEKIIVLDSCTGSYPGSRNFDAFNLPRNSKVIGADFVYRDSRSLAKLFYDLVIARKLNLEDITQKTFNDIKHNWVYFKQKE